MNRADKVHKLTEYCLYKEEELLRGPRRAPDDAVVVQGIVRTFAFHPGRLTEKKGEITEVLTGMHDNFYKGSGGGWSFLQLCNDAKGEHWAEHPTMEELVCLGISVKLVEYLMPRELWGALPGGMPYIAISNEVPVV